MMPVPLMLLAAGVGALAGFAAGAIAGGRRMYAALGGGEIEELRGANRELVAQLGKDGERTLRHMAELKAQTVWGLHVDDKPSFLQGDQPMSELHELVTAKECRWYVDKIDELNKHVAGLNAQVATLARALEASQATAARRRKPRPPGAQS